MGVNTLAAALAEEQDAIEEIYEPFLIQIGFPEPHAARARRDPIGVRAFRDYPEPEAKLVILVVSHRSSVFSNHQTQPDD